MYGRANNPRYQHVSAALSFGVHTLLIPSRHGYRAGVLVRADGLSAVTDDAETASAAAVGVGGEERAVASGVEEEGQGGAADGATVVLAHAGDGIGGGAQGAPATAIATTHTVPATGGYDGGTSANGGARTEGVDEAVATDAAVGGDETRVFAAARTSGVTGEQGNIIRLTFLQQRQLCCLEDSCRPDKKLQVVQKGCLLS